jgi:hypothetical protein
MSDIKTRTDLTGISNSACPVACNADRCVISGRGFCLHPKKTPMPPALESDVAVQAAWAAAGEIVGVKTKWIAS